MCAGNLISRRFQGSKIPKPPKQIFFDTCFLCLFSVARLDLTSSRASLSLRGRLTLPNRCLLTDLNMVLVASCISVAQAWGAMSRCSMLLGQPCRRVATARPGPTGAPGPRLVAAAARRSRPDGQRLLHSVGVGPSAPPAGANWARRRRRKYSACLGARGRGLQKASGRKTLEAAKKNRVGEAN